jgi:hypothetical protein
MGRRARGEPEYGMLAFRSPPWFVEGRYEYERLEDLIASIKENIIIPAEAKVRKLRQPAGSSRNCHLSRADDG